MDSVAKVGTDFDGVERQPPRVICQRIRIYTFCGMSLAFSSW